MEKERLESIHLRMSLAREKLAVARDLLARGYYNDAVSKSYYAMFYASRALLLALGEDPHRHTGVVALFGERVVGRGLAAPEYGRALANARRLREESDYDEHVRMTAEEAQQSIVNAEHFVAKAEEILLQIRAEE